MARKSRYNIAETTVVKTEKIWNTAVYTRLSNEDGGIKDSNSIETQIRLVKQFVEERPQLKLCSVYSDNGETGTNFNRPQFNAMLEDVKAGKINCIAVKDLSRFGRNYIETGNYMEKIFPFLGVRFISINDGYDSINPQNSSEVLSIALKSLMHDIYAKDASRKITAAHVAKQKRGEFLGGFAAYGYLNNPEDRNKLIINEETAPIVRDIFKWKIEGMSYYKIAMKLNDSGFPSPNRYRYLKGLPSNKRHTGEKILWGHGTVKNILQNPVYTGCMAQGKTKTSLIQGLSSKRTKPDEWIIIPNMHEPIINTETFEKVQKIFEKTKKKHNESLCKNAHLGSTVNLFKGIIKCGDCNIGMTRRKKVDKYENVNYHFNCRTYENSSRRLCNKKSINEENLKQIVLNHIQNEVALFSDMERLIKKLQNSNSTKKKVKTIKDKIADFKRKTEEKERRLSALYDDYSDGILSKEDYLFVKSKYTEEKRLLQEQIDALTAQSIKHSDSFIADNKWINAFKKFKDNNELTREMLTELVDKIIVINYNEVKVSLKYRNEYKELLSSTGKVNILHSKELHNSITESGAVLR